MLDGFIFKVVPGFWKVCEWHSGGNVGAGHRDVEVMVISKVVQGVLLPLFILGL